jgi:hypothetical protein
MHRHEAIYAPLLARFKFHIDWRQIKAAAILDQNNLIY